MQKHSPCFTLSTSNIYAHIISQALTLLQSAWIGLLSRYLLQLADVDWVLS